MNLQVTVDNGGTWVDIAMLVVAILTLATAVAVSVGAFLAYSQTKNQIKQQSKHHEEQLKASLRPLVAVPHAECVYLFDGALAQMGLLAWLQNVGPGPALDVELLGLLRVPKATRAS